MDDLIRRSDAENIFRSARRAMKPENYSGQEFFIRDNILLNAEQIVHSIPAVDAVEVRHGRWIDDFIDCICSVCNERVDGEIVFMIDDDDMPRYCPNCGAKMDGEDGDGDG